MQTLLFGLLAIMMAACGGGGGGGGTPVPVNTAPVANNQTVTTVEGTSTQITLSGSDADGDTLTFSISDSPTNGSVTGTAPNLTYTPDSSFVGEDSLTFTVNDGTVTSAAATISISVTEAPNIAPVATPQTVATLQNTDLQITLTGVDANEDSLSFAITNNPANGTLTGVAPNLTYSPDANFAGSDSFAFTVNDGMVDSNEAIIDINVTQIQNNAPVATPQTLSTNMDTVLTITLSGTDADAGDNLSFSVVRQPYNGTLSGTPPDLTYTPNTGFLDEDSFTFVINDGIEDSNIATIDINVTNSIPNLFSFNDLPEVPPGSVPESNLVLISGINIPSPVTISNGEYSINGANFTSSDGTIMNNQSVVVRARASNTALETVDALLTIGGVQDTFSITTSDDVTPPTADIVFPSTISLSPSSMITVRGVSQDEGTISSVTVNDIEADTNDNFANWTAVVPLQTGFNNLVVQATDLGGNTSPETTSATIESRVIFNYKGSVHFDNSTNWLVFYEQNLRSLYGFDPATQNYSLISDDTKPDNTNRFQNVKDIDIDEESSSVYSIDGFTLDRILSTDMETGTRTVITEDNVSVAEHTLSNPSHVVLDAELNIAYVFDSSPSGRGRKAIIKFDLVTGAATLVSDNTFPTQGFSQWVWPDSIALDKENNRILLSDTFGSDRILTVDLDTGARDTLWDSSNTITLPSPKGIVIDKENNRAMVYQSGQIISIDLDTGIAEVIAQGLSLPVSTFSTMDVVYDGSGSNQRLFVVTNSSSVYQIDLVEGVQSIFSNNSIPNTVNRLVRATGIDMDLANNRLLVTDSGTASLIAIDLTTAERTIVSDPVTPNTDNLLIAPADVAALPNNKAYVIDAGSLAFLRINMADGSRTVLSDNTVIDANNTFNVLQAMALDPASNRTLVVDSGRQSLLSVDNTSGDRSVISDMLTPGADNPIVNPRGMVLEGGRGLISEGSSNSILSVDLTSGERSVLSGPGVPDSNNNLANPGKMVLDTINSRLLVIDNDAVMAVSLTNGARTVLSSNTVPNGNHPFIALSDITLDEANQQALIMDREQQLTLAVNLTSGERSPYMGTIPTGSSSLYSPYEMVFDEVNNTLIVGIGESGLTVGLSKIDIDTGARTTISSGIMPKALDLEIDPISQRMFMISTNALYEVDRTTAELTIISGPNDPNNDNRLTSAYAMALDMENNLAYVSDLNFNYILAIDLDSGIRTVVSSNTFPDDSNPFGDAVSMIFDKDGGRLLVSDINSDAILAVDIATGSRTVFSATGIPDSLDNFSYPIDLLLDRDNNRLLVLDSSAIIAVDLTTGARTRLTDNNSNITRLTQSGTKMTMTSKPDQVIVTDDLYGVVLIDLVTGEQVIFSK